MTDAATGRSKKKGQRKAGKKIDPEPMVGLFNEETGGFDQPNSVRAVLKSTKIDISEMDLVAWSPAACREMKRLFTQIVSAPGSLPCQQQ